MTSANLLSTLLASPGARIVSDGESVGLDELQRRAGRWAGHLVDRHDQGSHIGLISGNDSAFVVGYLACLAAGMVAVPLNPLSPEAERRRDLAHVSLVEVLVGPAFEGAIDSLGSVLKETAITLMVESNIGGTAFDVATQAAQVDGDDIAVLLFTSGTAGASKPAILTHRNLRSSLLSIQATGIDLRSGNPATVGVVPLFHVLGLNIILNLGLAVGATIVLRNDFDAAGLMEDIEVHGATILAGPPNMWRALSRLDPSKTAALQHLTVALSGASSLDPTVARTMRDTHGVDLREGYGLTETCGVLCSGFGGEQVDIGSVGPVMPGVECRLVDADGADVLIGDIGEVWVRGPMVSPGYWNDEAATHRTRFDDWYRTGDLATVDESGHLSISGRTKDLVIVAGFNVHPAEVEHVLQAHPAVEAAAVVGAPDLSTGERVVAFVTLNEGAEAAGIEDLLQAHCRENLARYKVPRRIDVMSELPIGVAGKLRRRDLSN